MKKIILLAIALPVGLLLAACGGNAEPTATSQPEAANTLPPPATIEIDYPSFPTSTPTPPVPTLDPAVVTAVYATVQAANATATSIPAAPTQAPVSPPGERVNATQAPHQAPIIRYFYASYAAPETKIRYYLNWVTENANRVEIYGHVMDNPQAGSWPVYDESNHWVLWAANDIAWVESQIDVTNDFDTGTRLSDITVSSRTISVCARDPQFVDGDKITARLNQTEVVSQYELSGVQVCASFTLNPGPNTLEIIAASEGHTPPMVAELTFSTVSSGLSAQTVSLRVNEISPMTITAP
jgi:hypothetical protein